MAVSIAGFSIREYTAKIRSVDVVKCWPFDESMGEDRVRAILPPITVRKFSWWLDVLHELDDNVDDSDDVTVRKTRAVRGKARVPKKRSIIDIFAVAPQVEKPDDVDYYEDDEDDADDCAVANTVKDEAIRKSEKRNTSKKEKKMNSSKLKEVKKLVKKDKEKFKQKNKVNGTNCLDVLIGDKEKVDKLKVPNSFLKPSCSQHNKKCGNDKADCSPTYGGKPQRKHLVSEKKSKGLTNSKSSTKHHKMVIPVCSNLKKRTKRIPVENSTSGISCSPNDVSFCSNQRGDEHVTFSEDQVAEGEEVLSRVEEKGINEYILRTTEDEVTVQPRSLKQLSVVCSTADTPELLGHNIGIKDNSVECCDIFNHVAEGNDNLNLLRRGYRVVSNGSQYICTPRTLHVPQQMYNHQQKDQIVGSLINACGANERSNEQLKGSLPEVTGVCMHSVKAYPQHSSAYKNVNRKLLPETITGNCSSHFVQYQSLPQISSQELMCKICSFPEWKQRETIYAQKRVEENYVGLPLNSQGELINSSSNGKRKLTQLPSSSSRGLSVNDIALSRCMDNLSDARGWDKRTPPTRQLKLSFADDSMEWSPTFPVPSRLGIYEYDAGRESVELDPRKENEQSITPFELDRNVSNFSNHTSKQDEQAKQLETNWSQQYGNSDHVSVLVTPSKMRLMGKEFTVGRGDFHVPQDKRIWTDKQIIAENFPPDTYNYNSVVTNQDQQKLAVHPVLGTLKASVSCSPSIHINQAIPKSRVCSPHFSRQIDPVQQNSLGAINQNPFSFYNQKLNFEEPLIGGYRSLTISPYGSVPTSVHYSSQNGVSSSVDLNSARCVVNSPVFCLDSGKNFQSQFSSESTPWLSNAKEKRLLMDFHELNSTLDMTHQYCGISGDNRQIDPSVYLASERFCSLTQCPQPALENPVASPSLANYPPMPLHRGCRPNAGANNRHGDMMKLKEKIVSTPRLTDSRHCKKGKRKPISTSDYCPNSTKIPNLSFREDPSIVLTPLKRHSDFEGHFSCRQAFESGSVKGMSNSIQSSQSRTPNAGFGSFDGEDTFSFDCPLRSGPVKLIPGARHVLRPCQYNDQNFRPTHSTITFAAPTAGSNTMETAKPSKIYKF